MRDVLKCCLFLNNKVHSKMIDNVYHEKQVKELCALHAINNLYQRKLYSKAELDRICENLAPNTWINPHKSLLGLGNYDINVILTALQANGCEGIWFDKIKDPELLTLPNIFGFILNIPTDYKLGMFTLPFHRRHWIAIRLIKDQYYNLDSKNEAPQAIGGVEQLINYLRVELANNDKELFVVVREEVAKEQTWMKKVGCEQNSEKTVTT